MVIVVPEAAQKPPVPPPIATTLFVVGTFRSGTSLLYSLLNQHPQIAIMYECDVWNFPQFLSPLWFRHNWRERLEFYNNALSRHRLAMKGRVNGLENVQTPGDLYRVFAEGKDARIFGEKSPFYCHHLPQLAKNHPGASFILIWRDPVEIFRSVEETAQSSYYFRRPGMLNRLIYFQEKMIYGAAEIIRLGNRVHHVTYSDLIDKTEESCRGLCQFLDIEFDQKMTGLTGADLSAVFRAPQFEHLRMGKIARRQNFNHRTNAQTVQTLQRFQNRWNRLRRELLNRQTEAVTGPEPGPLELLVHRSAGALLCGLEGAIRTGFEFLPLPWLRTYRQAKAWFKEANKAQSQKPRSLREELDAHKETVLTAIVILAVVAAADYFTGAAISLMPFYLMPGAVLTLVINRRWGSIAAVLSALAWAAVQNASNPIINRGHPIVLFWDAFMRFLVIEAVVLLLDRIRIEITSKETINE